MPAGTNKLAPGEFLTSGQYLLSDNGAWIFIIPLVGTPTIIDVIGRTPAYNQDNDGKNGPFSKAFSDSALSQGWKITKFIMQPDGSLAGYDARGKILWAIYTQDGGDDYGFHNDQGAGNWLHLQDDGSLVIYNHDNAPIWDKKATVGHSNLLRNLATAAVFVAPFLAAPLLLSDDVRTNVVSVTQSPAWKTVAAGAVFIPGFGPAISAGMAAASVAGAVIKGKASVLDAASQGLGLANQAGVDTSALKAGFDIGLGVVVQNPTAQSMLTAYNQLASNPTAQAGFDAAVAIYKGTQAGDPPPNVESPSAKAGYYAQAGAALVPSKQAARAVQAITSKNPAAAAGAATAAQNLRTLTASIATTQALRTTASAVQQSLTAQQIAKSTHPMGFFEWLLSEAKAGYHYLTGRS